MIRVELQEEPDDFHQKVRTPGQDFLFQVPHPTTKQFDNNPFWRKALPDMMEKYNSICAYSSLWIKPDQPTIDHYISKSRNPQLAYEWKNFRLARLRINTRKGTHEDILDPFTIGENWFVMDFITFGIDPSPEIEDENLRKEIKHTIDKLDLDNQDYREAREAWYDAFKNDISKLEEKAPFVAYEMRRQGIWQGE